MTAARRLSPRGRDVDMTEGSVFRHLLSFAVPLFLGQLFQQLYNTVDTWVVGNFASPDAFSAVGTVSPIFNMLIGIFMGLSSGAGVVISQYYGAHKQDKVRDAVHTCIALTLVLTVVFTFVGIAMTPAMLRLMKMPSGVYEKGYTYLTIFFSGMGGFMIYNMGAGILRAVGDSKRPFHYLVVAALINIALDLYFVLGRGMDVEGVAYATIIAQGVAAVLVVIALLRSDNCVRVEVKKIRFHWKALRQIVRIGIPASLQMAITAFSNVFAQSYVNYFGPACMGGWTAYLKIDQLALLPMQTLGLSTTTFVGQNLGAGKDKRAREGVNTALWMSMGITLLLAGVIVIFAPALMRFFCDEEAMQPYGILFLRMLTPLYVTCCMNQIFACALRGAGNSRAPMIIMVSSFVVFRQIYLFVVSNYISNTLVPVVIGYPAGWALCSVIMLIYYHRVHLNSRRPVLDA